MMGILWLRSHGVYITGEGGKRLEQIDRELLKLLQNKFPLTPEPFKDLALNLGITQEEVIERIENLKQNGIIRRLGGVFDSRKLGYKSTLCAISVPEDRLDEVKDIVNGYTEVTHNYLRNHKLNMWFTVIASSTEKLNSIIKEISKQTGLEIRNFPASNVYKIKVQFKIPKRGESFAE